MNHNPIAANRAISAQNVRISADLRAAVRGWSP
jgi:hypothetical protein